MIIEIPTDTLAISLFLIDVVIVNLLNWWSRSVEAPEPNVLGFLATYLAFIIINIVIIYNMFNP